MILTVGPDQQYSTISAAIADAQSGDAIQVMAGTYVNDFAEINADITLEGVGGMVNMVCDGTIPNGKAIFVTNGNMTISNFSFAGAQVDDLNGAGIRYEGGNLILNNDYFHDNQMGLLAASDPSGSITISSSEFANNGVDPNLGVLGHNLYVNNIGTLKIDNSYFHDAQIGHEIKSRALNTIITNSRIEDGPTGTASYSIDLPNGGNALIQNNIIEKGPMAANSIIIAVGEEGSVLDGTNIQITGNQIINDQSPLVLAVWNATTAAAEISGNQFYGLAENQVVAGPITPSDNQFFAGNQMLLDAAPPAFDATISDSLGAAGGTVVSADPSGTGSDNWVGAAVPGWGDYATASADQSAANLSVPGFTMFGTGSFPTGTSYSSSAELLDNQQLPYFTQDPQLFLRN